MGQAVYLLGYGPSSKLLTMGWSKEMLSPIPILFPKTWFSVKLAIGHSHRDRVMQVLLKADFIPDLDDCPLQV